MSPFPSFFLCPSPARVARASRRRGPTPAPPRACSSASQDLRHPIACSAIAQDVLLRHPGPGPPPPGLRGRYPLPPPGSAPPPARTCVRLGVERLDREFWPRLDLKLELFPLLLCKLLLVPCSCSRPEVTCWCAVAGGPLLVLLSVRRSTRLLAFSSPVPELYLAPSISSTSTPRRNTGLGPVPCSSSYLCCCR